MLFKEVVIINIKKCNFFSTFNACPVKRTWLWSLYAMDMIIKFRTHLSFIFFFPFLFQPTICLRILSRLEAIVFLNVFNHLIGSWLKFLINGYCSTNIFRLLAMLLRQILEANCVKLVKNVKFGSIVGVNSVNSFELEQTGWWME